MPVQQSSCTAEGSVEAECCFPFGPLGGKGSNSQRGTVLGKSSTYDPSIVAPIRRVMGSRTHLQRKRSSEVAVLPPIQPDTAA